jgi:hypothetical protein
MIFHDQKGTNLGSKGLILGVLMLSTLGSQGCAHSDMDKQLDEKLANEPYIAPGQVSAEATEIINRAPDLSSDQRQKLLSLRASMDAQLKEMKEQDRKLRSLLIKELVSPYRDQDEVNTIKNRIENNENKKVSILFNSIDKADTILGHQTATHREVVEALVLPHVYPE